MAYHRNGISLEGTKELTAFLLRRVPVHGAHGLHVRDLVRSLRPRPNALVPSADILLV